MLQSTGLQRVRHDLVTEQRKAKRMGLGELLGWRTGGD